jgi:hypothetical protein
MKTFLGIDQVIHKLFFIMLDNKWCNTKETKSLLKISDCKLMHLRIEGKIVFKKNGREFLYLIENVKYFTPL